MRRETVSSSDWVSRAAAVRAEGYDWWGHLVGIDEPSAGTIDIVLAVGRSGQLPDLELRCSISRDDAQLDSVAGVWAGAAFAERETAEMLGVHFVGHPDPRPLLLTGSVDVWPLRRDVGLARRVEKSWPGAHEPGEGSRRRPTRPLAADAESWTGSV